MRTETGRVLEGEARSPASAMSGAGSRAERAMAWAAIALGSVAGLLMLRHGGGGGLVSDEAVHGHQLLNLARGQLELVEGLTTIPGYHVVLALLCGLFQVETVVGARMVSALMSLPATLVFFALALRLNRTRVLETTLQLHFLPILFPYFFLLFTDGFSLFLVLLSLYLAVCRRPHASALASIASVLVRQNNILWLFFVWAFSYLERHGPELSRERVVSFLRQNVLFELGMGAFVLFVAINHGVAVGDKSAHPMKLGLGNVYFFLLLYFFLFLPLNLAACGEALRSLRRWPVLLAAVLLFAVYMLTFTNDHPYNLATLRAHIFTEEGVRLGDTPFLRNELLGLMCQEPLHKALFFVPILLSALVLLRTRLVVRGFWLLYPLGALYLMGSWLIEQRYDFIPLALLLLARERQSKALELATAAMGLVGSLVLAWGIERGLFFL